MAMTGMETWIMWSSGGAVTSSLRFDASSVEAQAVIHALTVFDTGSIAQAAIIGYWHIVGGKEKFVDLSNNPSSAQFIDKCTGVQFQVLTAFASCGALANVYFFD